MNMSTVLNLMSSIPSFLVHAGALERELTADLKNPQLIQEIDANPYVKARITALSAEWRGVENDATGVKKSNILTFLPRANSFLRDAGRLVRDVQSEQHDAPFAAALADMPHLSAELAVIAVQWNAVQADLAGLKV